MKNFSAKNAEFETLKINNEAAISSADLGTAPNQIPLNKDLGSLAYMNAPQIEDLNVDTLELREIAAELSETAVDVFVYDTRKDSDGGAWRHRTSHTSWYNEELNTSTRGGRREFPAVAVIVAEANKVTIYDGDDPDLSMWMVFNQGGSYVASNNLIGATSGINTAISSLNGILSLTTGNEALYLIKFISDTSQRITNSANREYLGGIGERNSGKGLSPKGGTNYIINLNINDVAMTILPNAPIDSDTGLPIPTIAVATDGGVSVIKDDGSVVDITRGKGSSLVNSISFDNNNKLIINNSGTGACYYNIDIPHEDLVQTEFGGYVLFPGSVPASNVNLVADSKVLKNYVGHASSGLNILEKGPTSQSDGMIAYTTSSYNTGWMPGDIKLATLSDTKIEKVGVDETTELVTNGGFDDDDISGWTEAGSPVIAFSTSGVIDVTGDGEGLYQDIAPGTYLVSVGTISGTGGEVRFTDMDSSKQLFAASQSGDSLVITSVGNLRVYIRASGNNLASFDNISVKQTGELITNGTFDADSDWEKSSHWTISNGFASMPSTSQYKPLYQYNIGLIPGSKYVASIDVSAITGSIKFDTSRSDGSGITDSDGLIISSTGVHSLTFVAESDQDGIGVARQSNPTSCTISNISIRLAVEERSVNDNGLQVFGEITKTPVAPGADLVAYSGFSPENYLMQPYNPDLDFGTGDFCVMGWAKTASTDNQRIFTRNLDSNNRLIVYTISGRMSFYIQQDGDASYIQSTPEINHGNWFNFCCSRRSGVIEIYVDGKKQNNGTSSNIDIIRDINFGQVDSWIGTDTYLHFRGSIALLRISSTVPSVEQIAKIYRDEKPLFQDGAQATLYGTSDAVTALAYDDSEDLLHVGTASGRSVFNGLKRVDNTTTAVSTAISATEGLVIEQ